MNKIDALIRDFETSFSDKRLSKSEKKALRMKIAEAGLDQRKRDILRAKLFDIARAGALTGAADWAIEWVEDASLLLETKLGQLDSALTEYKKLTWGGHHAAAKQRIAQLLDAGPVREPHLLPARRMGPCHRAVPRGRVPARRQLRHRRSSL